MFVCKLSGYDTLVAWTVVDYVGMYEDKIIMQCYTLLYEEIPIKIFQCSPQLGSCLPLSLF